MPLKKGPDTLPYTTHIYTCTGAAHTSGAKPHHRTSQPCPLNSHTYTYIGAVRTVGGDPGAAHAAGADPHTICPITTPNLVRGFRA